MKTFIYTLSPRTKAGNVTATVYRVKHNQPIELGTISWNRYAYAGDVQEIRQFLMNEKQISKGDKYSHSGLDYNLIAV